MVYERCPRCEINYKQDWESVCDICNRELKGYYFEDIEEETERLCPYCERNIIQSGEMCSTCAAKNSAKEIYGLYS